LTNDLITIMFDKLRLVTIFQDVGSHPRPSTCSAVLA
jgi:hypothetical protein